MTASQAVTNRPATDRPAMGMVDPGREDCATRANIGSGQGAFPRGPPGVSQSCTAGTMASGCTALISSTGNASRSLPSGLDVTVSGVEGGAPGLIFLGTNGQQALPWGNGTSYRCVVPPLVRNGPDAGSGTSGLGDGSFLLDFNAWMAANPSKAPQGAASVSMQAWFRDPLNGSNQVTSMSDGLRFAVLP